LRFVRPVAKLKGFPDVGASDVQKPLKQLYLPKLMMSWVFRFLKWRPSSIVLTQF